MAFLQAGLLVATVVCLFVTGGALDRGFPIEVAIARGLMAFIAVALLAYVGELVVATAPPRARNAPRRGPAETIERAHEALALAQPLSLGTPDTDDEDAEASDSPQAA